MTGDQSCYIAEKMQMEKLECSKNCKVFGPRMEKFKVLTPKTVYFES